MRPVFVLGARRTRVAPRGGVFAAREAWELGASALRAALAVARLAPDAPLSGVAMGNALYGGGNPARMAALAAGLPEDAAALSIDTQCCAGLDAIALAAREIAAGDAERVCAGGLESFSRAPIRMRRAPPLSGGAPEAYARPPFAPDPARDPDPEAAAAALAMEMGCSEAELCAYAVASHAAARAAAERLRMEIAPDAAAPSVYADPFTRDLSRRAAARGGTAATMAIAADGAAALVLGAEPAETSEDAPVLRVLGAARVAGDPARPAEGALRATEQLLARLGLDAGEVAVYEVMEAFAAQALLWRAGLAAPEDRVNRGGGALARGHPIGASGAVLAVRLVHELRRAPIGAVGLAAISAMGGLGSALALKREG